MLKSVDLDILNSPFTELDMEKVMIDVSHDKEPEHNGFSAAFF